MNDHWYHLHVNPEPWSTGDIQVGRKSGKAFGRLSAPAGLVAYQQAVREELADVEHLPSGLYRVTFYIWREQVTYISNADKRVRKHQADATNMQKALEDALQGVLIDNDRNVQDIRTRIVEQGPNVKPQVIIKISALDEFNPDEIPDHVWAEFDRQNTPVLDYPEFDYDSAEELF